ncbi:MAG TPA: preprotein translocase subunit SecE [Clostridia bacterium]|jgi:preprotein translocase subunit SecE|nr:preprotein translocase subunit SecE [Clostridia bacterium]HHY05729.1 preprotein translocase subunit SecE [Clostridia bacterium]
MSVAKGEKLGLFGRLKRWFRLVKGELKKVHWPTKKEITTYTVVVIVAVVLVATAIWLIDLGLSYLIKLILH